MPRKKRSDDVEAVLTSLERVASKATRDGMTRYAIPNENALGVSMSNMKVLAKRLGRNHELAEGLWQTGIYEARMLATLISRWVGKDALRELTSAALVARLAARPRNARAKELK